MGVLVASGLALEQFGKFYYLNPSRDYGIGLGEFSTPRGVGLGNTGEIIGVITGVVLVVVVSLFGSLKTFAKWGPPITARNIKREAK
jgi:hypothetical protein